MHDNALLYDAQNEIKRTVQATISMILDLTNTVKSNQYRPANIFAVVRQHYTAIYTFISSGFHSLFEYMANLDKCRTTPEVDVSLHAVYGYVKLLVVGETVVATLGKHVFPTTAM